MWNSSENVWMEFKLRLDCFGLMEKVESTTIYLQYCRINWSFGLCTADLKQSSSNFFSLGLGFRVFGCGCFCTRFSSKGCLYSCVFMWRVVGLENTILDMKEGFRIWRSSASVDRFWVSVDRLQQICNRQTSGCSGLWHLSTGDTYLSTGRVSFSKTQNSGISVCDICRQVSEHLSTGVLSTFLSDHNCGICRHMPLGLSTGTCIHYTCDHFLMIWEGLVICICTCMIKHV